MTDYRDAYNPDTRPRRSFEAQRSASGMGGIIIAIAVVVIVFLGLSLLSGPSNEGNVAPGAIEQQGSTPAPAPAAPESTPATPTD